jgi:IS30 family transposase
MNAEVEMTIEERYKYLRKMKTRYKGESRKVRGQLLDEMEAMVGLHRKSLIRLINGSLERKRRRRQRGATYGPEVDRAIQVIAESLDYPCAERLTPNLVRLAEHLARHGELQVTQALLEQLARISKSTVERRLARLPRDRPRLPRRRPRVVNSVLRDVPMGRIPWDETEPGHFEVDLVHHCGPSASGEYVHTLQMVDVATGWSERQAVLGRSYVVMQAAFRSILQRLPFAVREIHPDNGKEFFNHHLMRFWEDAVKGVQLSRSRPYHKNDNRFVEQRNANPVRAYLGYDRLDTVAQTRAVNLLFDKLWIYYNLFQPVMRTVEKTLVPVPGQRNKLKRRYDQPRTPFERLCETSALSATRRSQLQALRDQINPIQLREDIYALIDYIFSLPSAEPGKTEDVYELVNLPSPDLSTNHMPVTLSFEGATPVR